MSHRNSVARHALPALTLGLLALAGLLAPLPRAAAQDGAGTAAAQPYLQRRALQRAIAAQPTEAAQADYARLAAQVVVGMEPEALTRLLASLEKDAYQREVWPPLVDAHGVNLLYLLLDLQATDRLGTPRRIAADFLLEDIGAGALLREYRALPAADQQTLVALLQGANPGADRSVGLTLFQVWLALDDHRAVFSTGQQLWMRDWSRAAVLPRMAAAVTAGGFEADIWRNAGEQMLSAANVPARIRDLIFYTALATELGKVNMLLPLRDIADLEDEPRLAYYQLIMHDGYHAAAAALLQREDGPEYRVLAAWAAAGSLGAPLDDAFWAALYADLTTEGDVIAVARLLQAHDLDHADLYWHRVLELEPHQTLRDAEACQHLSQNAERRAEFLLAAQHLKTMLGIMDHLEQGGDRLDALRQHELDLREKARPANRPFARAMQLATVAMNEEHYSEALPHIQAAIELDPQNFEARHLLYGAYRLLEDMPMVQETGAWFRDFEPQDDLQRLRLAIILLDIDELERAAACLQAIIDVEPRSPGAYMILAQVRERQHRPQDAIDLLERANALGADRPEASRSLAILHAQLGDWQTAEEEAAAFLRQQPDDLYGRLVLHIIRARQGKADRDALLDYLAHCPPDAADWAVALLRYFAGQLTQEQLETAAAAPEAAYQKQNRLCEYAFYTGQAAMIAGDTAAARARFQQAVDTRIYSYIEYAWAAAELKHLDK